LIFNDIQTTGSEVVQYYEKITKYFNEAGRVCFFFQSEYKEPKDGSNCIIITKGSNGNNTSSIGEIAHFGKCGKLVTVKTNVIVPSMRKAPFPIHSSASFIRINIIPK